jgi:hypothetical protein
VNNGENLVRLLALSLAVALPCVALAQQSPTPVTPLLTDASTSGADASASAFDDSGHPLPVERIVLRTGATPQRQPQDELHTPGPGRAEIRLESEGHDAQFTLDRAEDDIPRDLRRGARPAAREPVCRGDCMLYLPTSRPVRVSAVVNGSNVSADVTPPPEGVRLRFQQPSRGALIAAYVLYPTAAALAVSGTLSALLVQDPGARLGSAVGLFSGAALTLGIGIAANVVAFDGTVRSEPIARPTTQPRR